MHLTAHIVTICIVLGPTCCVTRCVHVPVCVCPCVSLLLLATTCKSQFHDSHAHFTDNKTTQKGAGGKEEGKGVKKNTILALAFCTFKKFKHSVYPFSLKNFWYIHPHSVTHTDTHTHAVCTGCNVPKFKLKHPFFHSICDTLSTRPLPTPSLFRHSSYTDTRCTIFYHFRFI